MTRASAGLVRIPAMLDPHVHLRGMDWAHKATFASETAAALAGGYWAVLDMPNTPPATTDPAALTRKAAEIGAEAHCDWGLYYGAAREDDGARHAEVAARTCGLKIYNNATTGTLLIEDQALRERHVRAWPATRPIAVHAEGGTVADILELVRRWRRPTHFCHISTAEEIALLAAAKADGLPVTVGVTPHHLILSEDDLPALHGFGRMKPELKTPRDQAALWAAIDSGLVDVIESDHAPHTLAEKRAARPAFGVPGLETTLPLLLDAVHEGRLTLARVVELVAERPRAIFGLTAPAETYALVDLGDRHEIRGEASFGRCDWSPFDGMTVRGRVRETWIRGRLAFDGERVHAAPGSGHDLFGARERA